LEITDAWASPTPQAVEVSAGYLIIHNRSGDDDRLLSATSARAERVEIHEMVMDGSVMRMRPLQTLGVPAGQSVALAPGGIHLMFHGVAPAFAEGETVPVRLTFENAGPVEVTLPVRRTGLNDHGAP
jgi:copper(I)-binding protein